MVRLVFTWFFVTADPEPFPAAVVPELELTALSIPGSKVIPAEDSVSFGEDVGAMVSAAVVWVLDKSIFSFFLLQPENRQAAVRAIRQAAAGRSILRLLRYLFRDSGVFLFIINGPPLCCMKQSYLYLL